MEGHVALVQGVGYPNPNRSHFEATQIWETAATDRPTATGWLGRYLDRVAPSATPGRSVLATNGAPIDFTAVALGDQVPTALLAQHVDVPAIGGLGDVFVPLVEDGVGRDGGLARLPVAQNQLALAAQIIGSDVGARVIFVTIGSFDTHSDQVGQQNRLLGYLAGGLNAFYKDLDAHGDAGRVLTMTFSEFGRRVQQNASNGTDHGTAMPLFVVGGRVKGGVYGDHPSLSDLDSGDLKYHTDFRSVYATVLRDWLGRDPADVIAGTFDTLPFV